VEVNDNGNEATNVLVGVANLAIREPNDAIAEWATPGYNGSAHAVKLSKAGSGNAGSTHLQFNPRGTCVGLTLQEVQDAIVNGTDAYSFRHKSEVDVKANYAQWELRFEDPDSTGWIEVTFCTLQGHTPLGTWTEEALESDSKLGYGGVNSGGTPFFQWDSLISITGFVAAADIAVTEDTLGDWVLTRMRIELWEAEPARYALIDEVIVHGVTYEIEPGAATAPGLTLSGPYTDVGYTEDGVTCNYSADITEIRVEEETFPIDAKIGSETIEIVANMAESSLYNIDKAIGGSVLSGSILRIGSGVLKEMSIKLTGITPAGFARTYYFPRVVATGSVGMSFRKAEKTIVPVTFRALKPAGSDVGTFVDNAA